MLFFNWESQHDQLTGRSVLFKYLIYPFLWLNFTMCFQTTVYLFPNDKQLNLCFAPWNINKNKMKKNTDTEMGLVVKPCICCCMSPFSGDIFVCFPFFKDEQVNGTFDVLGFTVVSRNRTVEIL